MMRKAAVLVSILAVAAAGRASSNRTREGKVFSLFSVVSFLNSGCQSALTLSTGTTTFRNGTCYSASECSSRGGQISGSCAAGFGACCVFVFNAGGTISENCSYIQNPTFPAQDTASAAQTYTISKCNNDVCFLRLDFETFTTQGPTLTTEANGGQCLDQLAITTSTSQNVPIICGSNAGEILP